ncbi:hypothetical protein PMZ80_011118 [Knufia obscura]|uniref:lytic cellulose monooxygenase (C4-dehydrogenating) n=2 Tax=Knufia TaxID=430999 RepID=A0AAN8I254_9EURO|nr:hypothetical protein PMZ80_011118 [Knufia obscura]KAK5947974.1 hypothetical protein OHC33_011015 [Knufia fluminis]
MSSFKTSALVGAITLLAKANAHGFVSGILAGGKYYVGQSHYSTDPSAGWLADNGDNGFASSLTDSNIICHNNAVPGTQYVTVAAGDALEIQWNTWPESHKGPMLDYLAPCGEDCTSVDPTALKFTKIDEKGLTGDSWASDEMIANNFTWVSTIPSSIAPGKYVLRHETIALHSAGSEGGAQAYPQCVNLEVTGSGSNSLGDGTLGTALYTPTDPGILINIYTELSDYEIPGPAVMAGGSSGGSAPAPSKPSTPSTPSNGTIPAVSSVTSSVAITAVPTTGNAAVSTTSSAPVMTATAGGRKFVCYEEI